jgi:uncharacterized protein with HEPN domain
MRSPLLYLSEMLNAIRTIKDFIQDMDEETFFKDEKTKSAVTHQILILGEALKGIPEDIKSQAPNLDWKSIAGMRDRLIHAYFNVDYDILWDTAKNRVPKTEKELERLIDELSSNK